MRTTLIVLGIALAAIGCKKSTTSTGGGGGGGGWLVGREGLMANVQPDGQLGAGYNLGATEDLNGIACRYLGEAWVVGAHGTLLYTNDAGLTWSAQIVPTTADLRALATLDAGPVFVAGDGTFLTTSDTGATWTELSDGHTQFRSIAAAQAGTTVLALSADGGLWAVDHGALVRRATLPSGIANAIALSPDGGFAIAAGTGLVRSSDGGASWQPLAVDPSLAFEDVRIAADGSAVAVGAGGTIANVDVNGVVSVQHVAAQTLRTLHIADPESVDSTGYAAGDNGAVFVTSDSGATWQAGPSVAQTVLGVDEIGFGHR